jgi:hypothetical protein
MRSTVGPVEGAIDTLNEGLSVERLREKADGPARDRSLLDSRIWKSGNKDDRRSMMCGRQSALQLETVDARHLNITNDAGRFAEFRRLQKLFSRRKTPGSESERPNEVCRRDANGFIVIDNRNERCFCHCRVVLEHWWCLHKTGDSTRPELPQSKALAYQDLLSATRTRPPTQPTASHRGPAVVDQSASQFGARGCRRSFFANGLATLLSSTAQPITQARKADECWYDPTINRTSVPRLNTSHNRSSVAAFLHQCQRAAAKWTRMAASI